MEVSMGRAGIVLGLEVSLLARNSTEWHRLLEICAITDTLILDEDGIYHPGDFNDRLLLGLKATMTEAELHLIHARMRGGVLNKAKRANWKRHYRLASPMTMKAGSCWIIPISKFSRQSDPSSTPFAAWFGPWRSEALSRAGLRFPRLIRQPGCPAEGGWGDLEHNRVTRILRNPRYAGAFFYGRTRFHKKSTAEAAF